MARSPRSAADPRLPNLFVIGVPKSATTLVHAALDAAPSVFMSTVKEPGYFTGSSDRRRGLDYYLDAYFAHAEGHAVRGESTPWYFYSGEAMDRIAELPGDEPSRFVVLLRRPSRRAESMYLDQVRLNRETRSFEQAVDEELAALEHGELVDDIRRRYVWCGLYAEHLERWVGRFGCDRVHVAFFEHVRSQPEAVWKELGEFLEHDLGPERFGEVEEHDRNPAGTLRWPRLDAMIRSYEGTDNRAIEAAKRVLPPGFHRRMLQRLGRMNRNSKAPLPAVDNSATLARLDEFFASDAERLLATVERLPPEWAQEDG